MSDMQDQNKTVVRTMYIFTVVAFIGSALIFIATLISLPYLGITALAGEIGLASCLVLFVLLRRKQYMIPRILIPFLIYGLGTFLIIKAGVHDEALLLYPLALSLAGLLLGRSGIIVFGVLTVLTTTFVALAQVSVGPNLPTAVVLVSITSLLGVMMYVLVNTLQDNYEKMHIDQQLLSEANRELERSHGSLESQVKERTQAAEAARLEAEAARSAAEAARNSLEIQVWLATGQTQLADVMRGEQGTRELARHVIQHMCRYLGAMSGALYVLENKTLSLAGAYAYDLTPDQPHTFQLGEGLVGQAAEDGKMLNSGLIPPASRLITTGLVSVTPRQVIAFPFHANGEVMGVIELAMLNTFTDNQQSLLERSSENIGIAFLTGRTRMRLEDLLVETQQQAEELQAQEEELRAANEELQAQANAGVVESTHPQGDRKLGVRRVRGNWKDVE